MVCLGGSSGCIFRSNSGFPEPAIYATTTSIRPNNCVSRRPSFLSEVLDALSRLHSNLPPTLTTSQVSSVKKMIKVYLTQVSHTIYVLHRLVPKVMYWLRHFQSVMDERRKIYAYEFGQVSIDTDSIVGFQARTHVHRPTSPWPPPFFGGIPPTNLISRRTGLPPLGFGPSPFGNPGHAPVGFVV